MTPSWPVREEAPFWSKTSLQKGSKKVRFLALVYEGGYWETILRGGGRTIFLHLIEILVSRKKVTSYIDAEFDGGSDGDN